MRLYLAGPMRGYPLYNFPAFHDAARRLREAGYDVWSPAEQDMEQDGFDPATSVPRSFVEYMQRDLPAVLASDGVATLPGWEKSQGASLEVHVADECDIPRYTVEELLETKGDS